MSRAKRWMIAIVAALFAVSSLATTAMAAQEVIQVECSESGSLTVRVSNGNWAAAKIIGEKGHFIPYRFSFEVYVDGVLVESETIEKGGNAHQNQSGAETCTFEETFEEDGHTITFRGEAEVIRRP